jgi:outer membrane protein
MNRKLLTSAVGLSALALALGASAQDNVVKLGYTYYTTHSHTDGITGVGVPSGSDASTGNASTVIVTYERMLGPRLGAEFVLGLPPRIKSRALGTVAFLGDDVLSAKFVAPTFFMNWHFGQQGDTWRPYAGLGINFTRFIGIRSVLARDVAMGDSTGLAGQLGVDWSLDRRWSLFGSVAALDVKSKLVASGSTALQTTIDFRPIVYTLGTSYRF